jgi:hypothetical protein
VTETRVPEKEKKAFIHHDHDIIDRHNFSLRLNNLGFRFFEHRDSECHLSGQVGFLHDDLSTNVMELRELTT